MLSPILAFTTDEAWEFIPSARESVHASVWTTPVAKASAPDLRELFSVREKALSELEVARQARLIGKALEARVSIIGDAKTLGTVRQQKETLRELLNVSQLTIEEGTGAELTVQVQKAEGTKCERCWHWETDVGSSPAHPSLCGRCVQAVNQIQAHRIPKAGQT